MTAPSERKPRPCRLLDIPLLDYREALELQRSLVDARHTGRLDRDVFILVEHPPVFTLGRRGGLENLTVSQEILQRRGIPVVPIERGGNITYHGPGQAVGYPIVHLPSAGWKVVAFVEALEEIMIRAAADFGVSARRDVRNRGVWVQDRKLGSIGIAVRHGVSFHGFALNAVVNLEPFDWVNPCGLRGVQMTSLARETGRRDLDMAAVRRTVLAHTARILGLDFQPADPAWALRQAQPTTDTTSPIMDHLPQRTRS
ncbi:lipoyl(octanoyl) transferase [Desulfacinum hydrothermale DSM 13146]|uniref:Octanoyltransferase n=1 Tax=Desulfacinum hydrothermale DSM 13146 TaxID=1121390 RepID=A0A1W1XVJ8_9BACT|nr:lipoyl(octanoyl) transferase LipB [Desulfacinum hydrothermale]SMC27897.1 lipoyl(octanoyl) transferase [Desulfacinum hydrothermale DSM 13146]